MLGAPGVCSEGAEVTPDQERRLLHIVQGLVEAYNFGNGLIGNAERWLDELNAWWLAYQNSVIGHLVVSGTPGKPPGWGQE